MCNYIYKQYHIYFSVCGYSQVRLVALVAQQVH